jgi:hypothetical protein
MKNKNGENLMKTYSMLLLIAFAMSFVSSAKAQDNGIEVDVDNEIDQMYKGQGSKKNQGNVVTQTVVVPQQAQQINQQQAVQKQPMTLIEASPLSDSRADMIRKNRQDEEMRTESKIVEKLEQSRMEDEKRRAALLFGDKFDNMQNTQQSVSAPAAQAPVHETTVIHPVYIQPKEEISREEVRAALSENDTMVAPVETRYFSGLAGVGEYPDVNNVKGNYSLGAAFGTRYDYFLVEGAFLMSNYSVDMPGSTGFAGGYRTDNYEVDQYQGLIAAKYQLLGGVVRPVLGGLISYSYRKFTMTNSYNGGPQDTGNSHAIDLGINAGVDFELSPKFSLAVDMKYMFNMSSRVTSNYPTSSYMTVGTPIEKLQYYIMGVAARVNF